MISTKLLMATVIFGLAPSISYADIDFKPQCVLDESSPECLAAKRRIRAKEQERAEAESMPIMSLTRADCDRLLINAKPVPGVNYQPDRSIDAPGSIHINTPENDTIVMPLDRYLDLSAPYESKASIGTIVRNSDGRIYYNGQPLFDEDLARIEDACRKLGY